jgi:hypothetical protein
VKYPAKNGPRASEVADVLKHLKNKLELVAISATTGNWAKDTGGLQKSDRVARELLELLY